MHYRQQHKIEVFAAACTDEEFEDVVRGLLVEWAFASGHNASQGYDGIQTRQEMLETLCYIIERERKGDDNTRYMFAKAVSP